MRPASTATTNATPTGNSTATPFEVQMSIPQTPSIPAYTQADRQYREDLIRDVAFARSLQRRPCVDQEIADWLAAEAEVDTLLTFHPRRP